jgi:hypothetical protein
MLNILSLEAGTGPLQLSGRILPTRIIDAGGGLFRLICCLPEYSPRELAKFLANEAFVHDT